MIVYAESSAVLAWLLGEPTQAHVLTVLKDATQVLCSRLTFVECGRALFAAEATERISATEANDARGHFAQVARQWSVLEMTEEGGTIFFSIRK